MSRRTDKKKLKRMNESAVSQASVTVATVSTVKADDAATAAEFPSRLQHMIFTSSIRELTTMLKSLPHRFLRNARQKAWTVLILRSM